jgi:hypothetical protein
MSVLTSNTPAMPMAEPFLDQASRQHSSFKRHRTPPQSTPGSWPTYSSSYSISTSSLGSKDSSASLDAHSLKAAPRPRPLQIPESPPTPPSNRSSGHVAEDTKNGFVGSPTSRLNTPPIIQQSPPTPEDTPPKSRATRSRLQTPASLRHALSATDSFTTAREDQWSTDEDAPAKPVKAFSKPTEQWWGSHQSSKLKSIGLGLGLESDDDLTPTREPRPKSNQETPNLRDNEMISLDGNWGEDLHNVKPMDKDFYTRDYPTPTVPRIKRLRREPPMQTLRVKSNFEKAAPGSSTLQERIEQRHPFGYSPIRRFGEDIQRPVSQATSSQEALVMDLIPQRQPVLRHSGKNLAFRNSRFDQSASTHGDRFENDVSHKLVHRNTQITNQHHHSIASELSDKDFPTRRLSQSSQLSYEMIPVVIIPRRQSSLKKKTDSDQHRKSQSLTSGSISSRPVTGERQKGYFDLPRKQRRAMSETLNIPILNGDRGRGFTPTIPPRSSSLSAPTSRVGSRTGSFTSAHSRSDMNQPHGIKVLDDNEHSSDQLVEQNNKLLGMDFPPPLDTPFSNPSSTPEALEVSQARAINFYPHTNHSVNLVIQSNSHLGVSTADQPFFTPTELPESETPTQQVNTLPQITRSGLSTTETLLQAADQVDSPLRNPRRPPDPPEPPYLMVIPPTPANGDSPSQERRDPLENETIIRRSRSLTRGPVSIVRRAFSQRRSEHVSSPLSRFKSISSSRGHVGRKISLSVIRRPSRVTEKKETKLHPFWRPRGFWDAFESEEEARYVVGEDFLDRGWTPWLDNSMDASHQRFSYMEPEVTLAVDGNHSLRKVRWLRRIPSSSSRGNSSLEKSATRMSWNSVQQRIKFGRAQRKERAAERKRRKLREDISGPMLMNFSNPAF